MYRSLTPFRDLTRSGLIPAFKVCRTALITEGVEMQIGDVIASDTFDRVRLRQLYEQRRVELAELIVGRGKARQAAQTSQASTPVSIVESDVLLDSDPVPVTTASAVEESVDSVEIVNKSAPPAPPKQKARYTPRRGVNR